MWCLLGVACICIEHNQMVGVFKPVGLHVRNAAKNAARDFSLPNKPCLIGSGISPFVPDIKSRSTESAILSVHAPRLQTHGPIPRIGARRALTNTQADRRTQHNASSPWLCGKWVDLRCQELCGRKISWICLQRGSESGLLVLCGK